MVHGRTFVIPAFVVSLESDVIVSIIMRAVLNEEITIMEQIKFDKGLTIRAGLQGPVTNSPMVPQKIIKKVPNGSERNLLCWKRLNRCNRNITMASTQTPNHCSRHDLSTRNIHSGATSRHEWTRINKMIGHDLTRLSRNCRIVVDYCSTIT